MEMLKTEGRACGFIQFPWELASLNENKITFDRIPTKNYLVYGPIEFTRPNKKMPVFRVTRPYINLLVKHRIFYGFLKKDIILCILNG